MTKKRLEKEASKWLRKYLLCCNCEKKCTCIDSNSYCEEQVLKAYVDSAEPREKRIQELEYTNKKISNECHKLVDTLEKKQNECNQLLKDKSDLQDLNNNLINQQSKLFAEKEQLSQDNFFQKSRISELEAQIEKMKRCFNCKYRNKFVESKCGECEGYSKWEIQEND